jgi:Dynein heavy chain C-terminal domain
LSASVVTCVLCWPFIPQLVSCFDARALSTTALPIVLEGGVLAPASSSTSELVPLPPVTVAWTPLDAPPPIPPEAAYVSPVYGSMERESVLTQLSLPIRGDNTAWILNGVAVFLGVE